METFAFELRSVSKIYPGGVKALDKISLQVKEKEWVSIIGASGSGKTTVLNILDGLDSPDEGQVSVLGHNMVAMDADESAIFRRENIGLVFQQFHMIPYLTAVENVMLAQYYHSLVHRQQALEALEAVQMGHRANHLPSQLSGGEQQRVCIARALINDPRLILADEPTGNLDEANEQKVFEILQRLHAKGCTLAIATHDRALAALGSRTIELQHGRLVNDVYADGVSQSVSR